MHTFVDERRPVLWHMIDVAVRHGQQPELWVVTEPRWDTSQGRCSVHCTNPHYSHLVLPLSTCLPPFAAPEPTLPYTKPKYRRLCSCLSLNHFSCACESAVEWFVSSYPTFDLYDSYQHLYYLASSSFDPTRTLVDTLLRFGFSHGFGCSLDRTVPISSVCQRARGHLAALSIFSHRCQLGA